MKTYFLSSILAMMLLTSGAYTVYGKDNLKTSYNTTTTEQTFLKRFEQAFLKRKQKDNKLKMGSLSVYRKDIVKGIEQQHPNYSQIINLGELPYPMTDCSSLETPGAPANTEKHYLLEVQEADEVFYYGVSVVSIFRAPSDVIPAHISKIAILVKPVDKTELTELLKSLQKK